MKPSLVLAAGTVLLCSGAGASDLGTIGPTYGIAEPHLLNFIEQRLRDKERSGELQRLTQGARARGIDAVRQPQALPGLRTTETARTFFIDPSFTLDRWTRNIGFKATPSPTTARTII